MSLIQINWLYLNQLQEFTHTHKQNYFKTNLKAHLKRTMFEKNVVLFLANLYLYYLFWARKMSLKHWKLFYIISLLFHFILISVYFITINCVAECFYNSISHNLKRRAFMENSWLYRKNASCSSLFACQILVIYP